MRFNLYHTFAMAALSAMVNAVHFKEEEEQFELPQLFDDRDDFDFAEAYNS